MSVCNFFLAGDRIVVLTDTLGYVGDRPAIFLDKLAVNAEARLAVTTRGLYGIGYAVERAAASWTGRADAEAAIVAMLPELAAEYADLLAPGEGAEVTLFGIDGAPFALRHTWRSGKPMRRQVFAPGLYLSPTLGKQMQPASVTHEQMRQVALLQQRVAKQHRLNMCVGGDMVITEITAAGVEQHATPYPDKAASEAAVQRFGLTVSTEVAA